MSMTHLPSGHPEIEPALHDQSTDDRWHVTHHRLGGLLLEGWTHTSAVTGEPYHRTLARIHAMNCPGSVSALYVGEMTWEDSDEIVPPFVSVRVGNHEPHRPKSEVVAYLTVDLARTLHDALVVALSEHDLT